MKTTVPFGQLRVTFFAPDTIIDPGWAPVFWPGVVQGEGWGD